MHKLNFTDAEVKLVCSHISRPQVETFPTQVEHVAPTNYKRQPLQLHRSEYLPHTCTCLQNVAEACLLLASSLHFQRGFPGPKATMPIGVSLSVSYGNIHSAGALDRPAETPDAGEPQQGLRCQGLRLGHCIDPQLGDLPTTATIARP